MVFKEEVRDILDVPKKYFICHASSSDLDMSMGLAHVIDTTYDLTRAMEKKYDTDYINTGECYVVGNIITLIVKQSSSDKPYLGDVENALEDLRNQLEEQGILHIAFPRICCGNMGLKWNDVKSIIKRVFEDEDVEILICHDDERYLVPDKTDVQDLIENKYEQLSDNEKSALYEVIKQTLDKKLFGE